MIRRGTTPMIVLLVHDYDLRGSTVYITLKQRSLLLTKMSEGFGMAYAPECGTILIVRFSQEDTLAFRATEAEIQVRWIDAGGKAWGTDIETIEIGRILLEGVITYE